MAIKIVFKPKNNGVAVWFKCYNCGCEFWADKYNMEQYTKEDSSWVSICPNCRKTVIGRFSKPWSEVFNIFDKFSNWLKEQKENETKNYYDRFL